MCDLVCTLFFSVGYALWAAAPSLDPLGSASGADDRPEPPRDHGRRPGPPPTTESNQSSPSRISPVIITNGHSPAAACSDWGFFQIVNHGVDASLVRKFEEEMRRFFKLPMETKRRITSLPLNPYFPYVTRPILPISLSHSTHTSHMSHAPYCLYLTASFSKR